MQRLYRVGREAGKVWKKEVMPIQGIAAFFSSRGTEENHEQHNSVWPVARIRLKPHIYRM